MYLNFNYNRMADEDSTTFMQRVIADINSALITAGANFTKSEGEFIVNLKDAAQVSSAGMPSWVTTAANNILPGCDRGGRNFYCSNYFIIEFDKIQYFIGLNPTCKFSSTGSINDQYGSYHILYRLKDIPTVGEQNTKQFACGGMWSIDGAFGLPRKSENGTIDFIVTPNSFVWYVRNTTSNKGYCFGHTVLENGEITLIPILNYPLLPLGVTEDKPISTTIATSMAPILDDNYGDRISKRVNMCPVLIGFKKCGFVTKTKDLFEIPGFSGSLLQIHSFGEAIYIGIGETDTTNEKLQSIRNKLCIKA